jgi:hypothetical protein
MCARDERYSYFDDNGVIEVRPRNMQADFLDERIDRFILVDQTLLSALRAVHAAIDPAYRAPKRGIAGLEKVAADQPLRVQQIRQELEKRFTVSLANVSIREILNTIAATHGGAWWSVQYRQRLGAYGDSTIAFNGFDHWRIAVGAQQHRLNGR